MNQVHRPPPFLLQPLGPHLPQIFSSSQEEQELPTHHHPLRPNEQERLDFLKQLLHGTRRTLLSRLLSAPRNQPPSPPLAGAANKPAQDLLTEAPQPPEQPPPMI